MNRNVAPGKCCPYILHIITHVRITGMCTFRSSIEKKFFKKTQIFKTNSHQFLSFYGHFATIRTAKNCELIIYVKLYDFLVLPTTMNIVGSKALFSTKLQKMLIFGNAIVQMSVFKENED